jgi:hypothetical protein
MLAMTLQPARGAWKPRPRSLALEYRNATSTKELAAEMNRRTRSTGGHGP